MTNVAEWYGSPRHILMSALSGILESFDRFPRGYYDQEENQRNILSIKEYFDGSSSQIEGPFSVSTTEFLTLIGSAINLTEIEVSRFDTDGKNRLLALLHSLIKFRSPKRLRRSSR